jgi:polyferredoxin
MTDPPYKTSLLSPWRRRFQWATTLLLLLIPWIDIQGIGLLRIDLANLQLHAFGQVLRIEELYLFLLFCLAFGVGFLLVTMVFGRVWCGWACPQTTLTDLAEWLSRRFGLEVRGNRLQGEFWRKGMVHSVYLLLALLVGANLVWYFIAPQRFFAELAAGTLHLGAWASWAVIALTLYLDLALVRRLMCRDFCPYGRFQTVLADQGTLTLHLPAAEAPRCIKCGSCVRSCPMEIDIRAGFQIECINCGRCLDACRTVMAPSGQTGLIRYSFGTDGRGAKALLNPRSLLLTAAMLVLLLIFSFAVGNRQLASLKVSVSHTVSARALKDGQLATFFNAWASNRSSARETYQLQARNASDQRPLTLKGQTSKIVIEPGSNRKIDFVLVTDLPVEPIAVEFVLSTLAGDEVSIAAAQVTSVRKR